MTSNKFSFTKVLSANDIGKTGSHQSGIVIPRKREILALFPTLDSTCLNPSAEINSVTDIDGTPHSFLLRFIYYNGRLLGENSRNEYRLTRMTALFRLLNPYEGDSLELSKTSHFGLLLRLHPNLEEQENSLSSSDHNSPKIKYLSNGWTMKSIN
jgi:hypothetical protein